MKSILLVLILACSLLACTKPITETCIRGTFLAKGIDEIRIGEKYVPVSEDGTFEFVPDIKGPAILDISFENVEWSIFLSDNCQLELIISDRNLKGIQYLGGYQLENMYLLSTDELQMQTDRFFNENWTRIHWMNQSDFTSVIDSMKGEFFHHLDSYSDLHAISEKFNDAWRAEISYSFNTLILRYPERYMQFPPVDLELEAATQAYLKSTPPDRMEYFELPGFRSYTLAWIDYHSGVEARQADSEKHYGLRLMDQVFLFIPETFQNQYLKDFWMASYLKDHISEQGISNAQEYLELFRKDAKTEAILDEMETFVSSVNEARSDHEIEVYKSDHGFQLEAHIFRPENQSIVKHPAIVIFHGGGWNSGDPSWSFSRARHFQSLGMVAIAAQYRLTNRQDITAVESMSDARDLILWMRSHAEELYIHPEKIVGYGWSAGAHLISSAAIFPDTLEGSHITSSPNALVLVSPAVSLPKGEGWKYWNYNVLGTRAKVKEVNPVEHVREGLPATLILVGKDDTVTPLEGVQVFHERMKSHGNHCDLFIYDGVGHLFTPNYLPDNGWPRPDEKVQTEAFNQADTFLRSLGYIH